MINAIYLADIRQHARKRFAQTRQLGAVQPELTLDFGDRGVRIDEPAVAALAFY
jgi:hypothetical protein